MEFDEFSRFNRSEKIVLDGNETVGTWVKPSWLLTKPDDDLIFRFKVSNILEGRPDLISNNIYQTPSLAWVLISFNATYYPDTNARDVFNWPKTNQIIYYPDESLVFPELF